MPMTTKPPAVAINSAGQYRRVCMSVLSGGSVGRIAIAGTAPPARSVRIFCGGDGVVRSSEERRRAPAGGCARTVVWVSNDISLHGAREAAPEDPVRHRRFRIPKTDGMGGASWDADPRRAPMSIVDRGATEDIPTRSRRRSAPAYRARS
jgi:hypothetical protein